MAANPKVVHEELAHEELPEKKASEISSLSPEPSQRAIFTQNNTDWLDEWDLKKEKQEEEAHAALLKMEKSEEGEDEELRALLQQIQLGGGTAGVSVENIVDLPNVSSSNGNAPDEAAPLLLQGLPFDTEEPYSSWSDDDEVLLLPPPSLVVEEAPNDDGKEEEKEEEEEEEEGEEEQEEKAAGADPLVYERQETQCPTVALGSEVASEAAAPAMAASGVSFDTDVVEDSWMQPTLEPPSIAEAQRAIFTQNNTDWLEEWDLEKDKKQEEVEEAERSQKAHAQFIQQPRRLKLVGVIKVLQTVSSLPPATTAPLQPSTGSPAASPRALPLSSVGRAGSVQSRGHSNQGLPLPHRRCPAPP
jgi:hypothetical protein